MKALFVTGTDTGVGKTHVSCALLVGWAARGARVSAHKPVASGTDAEGASEDALLLAAHASCRPPMATLNPIALREAVAPHLAARREGVELSVEVLLGGLRAAAEADSPERLVVEGAGGWLTPLNRRETLADFARAARLPVVMVVALRLGCLNHALLTAASVRAHGCQLAAWVANSLPEDADMPLRDENRAWLEQRIEAPCLGWVEPSASVEAAAARLDFAALESRLEEDGSAPGLA